MCQLFNCQSQYLKHIPIVIYFSGVHKLITHSNLLCIITLHERQKRNIEVVDRVEQVK